MNARLASIRIPAREVLLAAVILLLTLSTVMVFSASAFHYAHSDDPWFFLKRQALWLPLAALVTWVFARLDYRVYRVHHAVIVTTALILLALVLVPGIGVEVNSSRRWLPLSGSQRFQPSEIAKLALLLFVAAWLTNRPERRRQFLRGFCPPVFLIVVMFVLTLLEPDLGTSLFLLAVSGVVLVLAGVRKLYLIGSTLLVVPILFVYVTARWEMVERRLQGLLNPDELHQLRHSLRALGSGGLTGTGLGAGLQKLRYLPEAHTDFIFAVIGEEMGFVGCIGVIVVFGVLVWAGASIAARARDQFAFLVASGITLSIGLQALINLAVVTGSAPTKGIALPFVTFGGTGLCVTMAQIGILLSIARVTSEAEERAAMAGVERARRAPTSEEAREESDGEALPQRSSAQQPRRGFSSRVRQAAGVAGRRGEADSREADDREELVQTSNPARN